MKPIRVLLQVAIGLLVVVIGLWVWKFLQEGTLGGLVDKPQTIINHNIVIEEMQQMGKLELVKYKLRDVLEYKEVRSYMPDSKAVLIISGEAVGCLDLQKITQNDIVLKDSILYIKLPQPELCYVKVNHNDSKVYDSETFLGLDKDELIQKAYRYAENQIQKVALESNILEQTKKNAELILKPFLERTANRRVIFTYQLPSLEVPKEIKPVK